MSNLSKLIWHQSAPWFTALFLSGCAVGAGLDDDSAFFGADDASIQAAAPPVADAATYQPLPPALGLPSFDASAPIGPGGTGATGASGDASVPSPTNTGTRPTQTSDSETSRPQQTRDAGSSETSPGSGTTPATGCDVQRCTNTCALDGPFNCCTLLDTCGCTWAPGAYCL